MHLSQTVYLDTEVSFAPFLAFSRDRGLYSTAEIQVHGDDPFELAPTSLEDLVDAMMDGPRDRGDYQHIYCIAHELRRITEHVSEIAQRMEDGNSAIETFFDLTPGDLDE
jgi:hypothetical protein